MKKQSYLKKQSSLKRQSSLEKHEKQKQSPKKQSQKKQSLKKQSLKKQSLKKQSSKKQSLKKQSLKKQSRRKNHEHKKQAKHKNAKDDDDTSTVIPKHFNELPEAYQQFIPDANRGDLIPDSVRTTQRDVYEVIKNGQDKNGMWVNFKNFPKSEWAQCVRYFLVIFKIVYCVYDVYTKYNVWIRATAGTAASWPYAVAYMIVKHLLWAVVTNPGNWGAIAWAFQKTGSAVKTLAGGVNKVLMKLFPPLRWLLRFFSRITNINKVGDRIKKMVSDFLAAKLWGTFTAPELVSGVIAAYAKVIGFFDTIKTFPFVGDWLNGKNRRLDAVTSIYITEAPWMQISMCFSFAMMGLQLYCGIQGETKGWYCAYLEDVGAWVPFAITLIEFFIWWSKGETKCLGMLQKSISHGRTTNDLQSIQRSDKSNLEMFMTKDPNSVTWNADGTPELDRVGEAFKVLDAEIAKL